jgi:anti-sigma factor RsiW
MRCHEARQFLGAYLDSELDAKTTQEIESHLENCRDCAAVFAAEEKLDARLLATLRQGQRTPEIWDSVEARIRPARYWRTWRWAIAIPTAACAVFVAAGLWLHTRPLDAAVAAEQCHREYVEQIIGPELPGELASKLGDRLDANSFSLKPSAAMFTANGARVCHLDGVPVALTLGHCRHTPISLIVFRKTELEHFPQTKQRLESGDRIACSRAGRFQFAARIVGDHVVCAIGDTARAELEDLVKSVNGPA